MSLIRIHAPISFFTKLLLLGHFLQAKSWVSGDPPPIDSIFKLPSPLPTWPSGGEFATGEIDLGGLRIRQVSTFQKVWTAEGGGPDGQGATFFEPAVVPDGFSMLGSYAQANSQPLFGWVLVGNSNASDPSGQILRQPTDYTLVLASAAPNSVYFWFPTPPDGYRPIGYVVTATPDKPPLDRIRCVRSDFTDEAEPDRLIWDAEGGASVYGLRPKTRGANAQSVSVGTFIIQSNSNLTNVTICCLKNKNTTSSPSIPSPVQIQALFQAYSPYIYFHSGEGFLPSSVNWFFGNGALLYTKGQEASPVGIHPNGTNLPQGGANDGLYWMDLPVDQQSQDNVKKGNLETAEAYLHVKSVLGATFTDIQVWVFYPFNGHSTAKLGLISKINLGKIGEHVGDWEHVTLRISNFDGALYKVFFGQHSKGQWVDCSLLEYQKENKFVSYSALNSHATYYQGGLHLHGGDGKVGLRDDTTRSSKVWDSGARFQVLEAGVELPWLNYYREWGPNKTYEIGDELNKVEKLLPGKLKSDFKKLLDKLPDEVFVQQGPTGPKLKNNWSGDEED